MFAPETTTLPAKAAARSIVGTVDADGAPHASRGWGLDGACARAGRGAACSSTPTATASRRTSRRRARSRSPAADVPTLRSVQLKGDADGDRAGDRRRSPTGPRAVRRRVLRRHRRAPTARPHELLRAVRPDRLRRVPSCASTSSTTRRPGPAREHAARADRADDAISARAMLHRCFEGASRRSSRPRRPTGTPNVTYLSRVRIVDDERVALSNQFFSKTARNLAENPRASVLVIDPLTYDQYRLTLVYERTERRGPSSSGCATTSTRSPRVTGMQDVFKLRAADIYRVVDIEQVLRGAHAEPAKRRRGAVRRRGADRARRAHGPAEPVPRPRHARQRRRSTASPSCSATSTRCSCCSTSAGERLFTIASHGYPAEGVGSEVASARASSAWPRRAPTPIRVGNLRQMVKYGTRVRRSYEEQRRDRPGLGDPGARARRRREPGRRAGDRARSARRRARASRAASGRVQPEPTRRS